MKIILVEDDHLQADEIQDALEEVFSDLEIKRVESEYDFYNLVDEFEETPPDIIIMDVMVRWAYPSPAMPEAPEDVITGQHYRAGFRCLKRLAERKKARSINVILYTVLEPVDIENDVQALPPNVTYLVKESSYNSIIRKVRSFTANRSN